MLVLVSAAPGLLVGAAAPAPARASAVRMADDIMTTLGKLEGPEIFWGSAGVALGYDESDIQGYDMFDKLVSALEGAGLADTLKGGEYTLLAPANSAFDKHAENSGAAVTADALKYHVIEGKVPQGSIAGDLKTLNGGSLTYGRRFRKTWLDNAIVGLKSEGPSKSSNWPCDVECSNGLIHAIDTVLIPGAYKEA